MGIKLKKDYLNVKVNGSYEGGSISAIGGDTVIDSSLTQPGQAADAKAVGQKLDEKADKVQLSNYVKKTELGEIGGGTPVDAYTKEESDSRYVSGVKMNGESVVTNGTANIPVASKSALGVVKIGSGLNVNETSNSLYISNPSEAMIDNRDTYKNNALTLDKIDYATQQALANPKTDWDDSEKDKVKETLGVTDDINEIMELNEGISFKYVTDDSASYEKIAPYNSRNVSVNKICGKSVVWNQIISDYIDGTPYSALSGAMTKADNVLTYRVVTVGSASYSNALNFGLYGRGPSSSTVTSDPRDITGHTIYYSVELKPVKDLTNVAFWRIGKKADGTSSANATMKTFTSVTANKWNKMSVLYKHTTECPIPSSFQIAFNVVGSGLVVNDTIDIRNVFAMDLTVMFGAGNEPTISEFEAMLTESYYPYSDSTIIDCYPKSVVIGGKNILKCELESVTQSGITIINNGDGSYTLNGTATAKVDKYFTTSPMHLKGTYRYSLNAGVDGSATTFSHLVQKTIDGIATYPSNYGDMSVSNETEFDVWLAIRIPSGAVLNNLVIRPQLERGSATTEYATYKEPTVVDVDDFVKTYFPDGMRSAETVYDEIDLKNKVATKRINSLSMSGITINTSDMMVISPSGIPVAAKRYPNAIMDSLGNTGGSWTKGINVGSNYAIYWSHITNPTPILDRYKAGTVYYELEQYVETPIDGDFEILSKVSSGDYIAFVNSYGLKIPSTNSVDFLVKTNQVVTDVKINETSIVENGIANIPRATSTKFGVIGIGSGLQIGGDGNTRIYPATKTNISEKTDAYRPITSNNLDYAVKKALSDCKLTGDDAWKPEEQSAAKQLLGIVDGGSTDVQINGTSITENGVANIVTNKSLGMGSEKILYVNFATKDEIDRKIQQRTVAPNMFDYAVKKALADCKLTEENAWTPDEQKAARELLGINEIGVLSWDKLTNKPFGEEVKTVELTLDEEWFEESGEIFYYALVDVNTDPKSIGIKINGEPVEFDFIDDEGYFYYENDDFLIDFSVYEEDNEACITVILYNTDINVDSITATLSTISLLDSKYLDIDQILSNVESNVIDCTGMNYNQIKEIMDQLDNYNEYCFIYNYLNNTYYLTRASSWSTEYIFSSIIFSKGDMGDYIPRIEYLYVTQSGNETGTFYPIESNVINGYMRLPTKMIHDEEYGDYEDTDYGQEGQILASTGKYDKFVWIDPPSSGLDTSMVATVEETLQFLSIEVPDITGEEF